MNHSETSAARHQVCELIRRQPLRMIATRRVVVAFENSSLRVEDNQVRHLPTGADGTGLRIAFGEQNRRRATIIPMLPDGQLVLINRYRYAPGKWSLEFPRGAENPVDDCWRDSAARTLLADTGLTSDRLTLLGATNADPQFSSTSGVTVLAEGCQVSNAAAPSELISGSIMLTPECLAQFIRQGDIDCGVTLAALSLLHAWRMLPGG